MKRILILAVAASAAPFAASAAAAQEFEPHARVPEVRVPFGRMAGAEPVPVFGRGLAVGADWAAGASMRIAAETDAPFPLLVIPALFADSDAPLVDPTEIASVVFGTEGRTLTTYYLEMSGGSLRIEGAVPAWVRTGYTVLEAAGSQDGHGFVGDSARAHFRAAVDAVDPDVDFTQYDNDGPDGVPDSGDDDGFVDAVAFKFAEVAGSCGGPGFWPHRWVLLDAQGNLGYPTLDSGHDGTPIRVAGYTTESVVECDGVSPQGPNVMAHEFGHVLGLPDFYRAVEGIEATQRHWHMGCFALMAAGSWGCGDQFRVLGFGPSGMSAISRWILGWAQPTVVGEVRDQEFELGPIQSTGHFLQVPLTDDGTESLLITYRPLQGFDDVLPAGGVLVYHLDTRVNLFGGARADDYPIHLVEADGRRDLGTTLPDGGNRGETADVFARAGAVDSLTPFTDPPLTLRDGSAANVWIHSMRVEGGVARVRLTTASNLVGDRVLLPPTARALERLEIQFGIRGGAPPYEAVEPPEGYPIDGLSTYMDGSEVVVEGVPLVAGVAHRIPLHVRDSRGDAWVARPLITFQDGEVNDDTLLDALLDPAPRSADVRTYLDNSGNANGAFDLGDMRAYLLRTGS